MPKPFLDCLKRKGSKVRTKRLSKGRYMRLCIDKSGKIYKGEVATRKDYKNKSKK